MENGRRTCGWRFPHRRRLADVAARCDRKSGDKYQISSYSLRFQSRQVRAELVFDDDVVWIARLFTHHAKWNPLSEDETSRKLRCEVATLKLVKARMTIPVPVVFAFSDTSSDGLTS
ncbi:hypothetical protein EXIGLDRAFT_481532 [Exidia glandulosa HHB12029]|uniref:Uncharacterized protein n=1 Tax=Exidia glandulosa HHB12029 TaxID=1314781 RepID=A0A165PH17_EXIGL|nr:hypothetical protein EXIGLDRAFT_481532 [Exidia glandulosa HHB12029]